MDGQNEKKRPALVDEQGRSASRGGFVLIIVVTLAMVLSLMAAIFLRTARQTLRTVQVWEKYDHVLLAAQSMIDAQRYELDLEFNSNIATTDTVRLSDLYALTNEVATGDYDEDPDTMDDVLDHVTNFPYADQIEVWVDVEATSGVDETNESVDISITASVSFDSITRQFREVIRYQTTRSIFRYALFCPEMLRIPHSQDLTINGDIRSNREIGFSGSPGDLTVNGKVVSSRLVVVGTNSLDYSLFPTRFDASEYLNPQKNSGTDVSDPAYPFGFCRPLVNTTSNSYGYVPDAVTNLRVETEFELVMPHIDTAWLATNVTGTLTNGAFPGRTKAWNGNLSRLDLFNELSRKVEYFKGYSNYTNGVYETKVGLNYWQDEVLVTVVSNYYGGTSGSWVVKNRANGTTKVVTSAKGPDSLYLDFNGTDVDMQDHGCLRIMGSLDEPFVINGNIVVEKDVYIAGFYTGQGSIYAGRNIYITDDLIATNPPVWTYATNYTQADFTNEMATMLEKDFLGLFAEGSIIIQQQDKQDPWVFPPGDGEFRAKFLADASTNAPYRTLATDIYKVDYINGEPWFDGDFTKTNGSVRVAPATNFALRLTYSADFYDRWEEIENFLWYHGVDNTNGVPCSYIAPLVSSNAYMAYIRQRNSGHMPDEDWTDPDEWDKLVQESLAGPNQIDAVLYTENLFGPTIEEMRLNGGLYYRKGGYGTFGGTVKFGDKGLRGAATKSTLVQGSLNWDCRLAEDEFNKYLPLSGIESSVQEWAELMPTNQPPSP